MKIGIFCGYDNPTYNYRTCFEQQARLVREAEALGFDEAWVGERHFNPDGVCPSILVLLGFLILMNALAIFLRNRFERTW